MQHFDREVKCEKGSEGIQHAAKTLLQKTEGDWLTETTYRDNANSRACNREWEYGSGMSNWGLSLGKSLMQGARN